MNSMNSKDENKKNNSPFKKPDLSSKAKFPQIPTQNRFSPITPKKPTSNKAPSISYSSLVQAPVTISPQYTPLGTIHTSPGVQTIDRRPQNIISKTSSSKASSSSSSSSYFINQTPQVIKILEENEVLMLNQGYHILSDYLFSRNSLFIGSIQKTREYYQAILIDTGSIKINHHYSPSDTSKIDFSKVHIFRVLSLEDCPYNHKTLSNFPCSSLTLKHFSL